MKKWMIVIVILGLFLNIISLFGLFYTRAELDVVFDVTDKIVENQKEYTKFAKSVKGLGIWKRILSPEEAKTFENFYTESHVSELDKSNEVEYKNITFPVIRPKERGKP